MSAGLCFACSLFAVVWLAESATVRSVVAFAAGGEVHDVVDFGG